MRLKGGGGRVSVKLNRPVPFGASKSYPDIYPRAVIAATVK